MDESRFAFDVSAKSLGTVRDEAALVLATDTASARRHVASVSKSAAAALDALIKREAFTAKAGQVQVLHGGGRDRIPTLVVAGVGPERTGTLEQVQHAAANGAKAARGARARHMHVVLPTGRGSTWRPERLARAAVEGIGLGLYRFGIYQRAAKEAPPFDGATILAPRGAKAPVERGTEVGRVHVDAVSFARDLSNEPGNTATPVFLAEQAIEMAARHGLDCRIFDEDEMRKMGMGALLAVSQGSRQPARLIQLTYTPKRSKGVPTVALVGKGLTFDAGGISLKPGARMEDMKFDMCGGAAVLGAMQAIAERGARVRVVGLVPSSENLPDGDAYKPGDILTAMDGTTIEIRNTDAEGRLLLADSLVYATQKMRPRPKAVVDLATLTGACLVALGDHHGALVSNRDDLAARLLDASEASGDALWRMPLTPRTREQLKSPYADLSNLGTSGAGTLTAAAFLEHFAGKVPWAHLDIAGMAWTTRTGGPYTRGGTGFGVRVLSDLIAAWRP